MINNFTINLFPNIQKLTEVIANQNNTPEEVISGNTYSYFLFGEYLNIPILKYTLYVPNDEKLNGQIKELIFCLSNTQYGNDKPFRANVWSKSKEGKYLPKVLLLMI